MAPRNFNLQFLNQNSQRAYPLTDAGSKLDVTGAFTLPDSLLLALYLPVHAGLDVEPEKFYVQSFGIYPQGIYLAIGYDDGTPTPPLVAALSVLQATHTEFQSYEFQGVGDFDDTAATVAIGDLTILNTLPPGLYNFEPDATNIETDAIRPILREISSIAVVNGADQGARLYGDIQLVAGNNMQIAVSQPSGSPPQITFSAIQVAGLTQACACPDTASQGAPIRFINGIPPLPDGNYRLIGDACVQITPVTNGLQFTDVCSQPCRGCKELTALVQQLDRFADGAATLSTFVNQLGAATAQMNTTVLGSKLSDQGCS